MEYKVGDKVRIRKDLISGTWFHDCLVTRDMCEMGGKEAVIKMVRSCSYLLSTKGTDWSWTDEMLEAVNEEVEEIDKPEPAETPQVPFGFHTGEKLFFGLDDGSASTITNAVKAFLDQADFKDMPPIEMSLRNSNEPDMIQKPPHYNKFTFQPIDIIAEVTNYYEGSTAFHIGTVLKYLCRAPFKGKLLEDLKKANYYLTRAIEEMEEEE